MTTGDLYDEILPERATVAREYGDDVAIGPARAGDTIEVACPECGGPGYSCGGEELGFDCDGSGTLRVLLTEDPTLVHDQTGMPNNVVRYKPAWRHVGEVQP